VQFQATLAGDGVIWDWNSTQVSWSWDFYGFPPTSHIQDRRRSGFDSPKLLSLSWNPAADEMLCDVSLRSLVECRQSTDYGVSTDQLGGAILSHLCDRRVVRDVKLTRWQHGAVEMKDALPDFACRVFSEASMASAVHRMFSFSPTIVMREATVG